MSPSSSKSPTKKFTWSKSTEQQKLLDHLVVNGEAFKMKPIDLYNAYPLFQVASQQVFRAHLNATKSHLGGNLTRDTTTCSAPGVLDPPGEDHDGGLALFDDAEDSGSILEPLPRTDGTSPTTIKKRKGNDMIETNAEIIRPKYKICIPAKWKNPTNGYVFVDYFFLLPSGVNDNTQYAINVDENGMKIIFALTWPRSISDVNLLQKIAFNHDKDVTTVHPLMGSITDYLQTMKENINDNVTQEFEADLPIKVQQEIKFIKAVETREGSKIIHIRLQGITENYANKTRDEGVITLLDF